ncbi:MAG TPA: formate--tetrahydrofolate ligase [Erysipelotrichaceae bacterium]|nr:formate--tetrahydrofolate ligase [Erysipelotrichaceae bacterium]
MSNIFDIAKKINIDDKYVIPYGYDKAKISLKIMDELEDRPDGKLVLVTAITPTKAGEGKTTTSIGLSDGLNYIGVPSLVCLREPSLGPVFGIKGGATGGGKALVVPSEDINLHFTGDMHALTSSINLIAACIDNSIFQGNPLNIDPKRILWKRALDMNDRALRKVTISQGETKCEPRQEEFVITVASELMAILCLARDADDFMNRVNNIMVAYSSDNKPIFLRDLRISHAVMKLMVAALNPNLVQTLEGNPAFIHGGPFANIAHGCNSIIATKMALKLSPVVVTEAGFGADLGAEKFFNIKCQVAGLKPHAVVVVATIRALKMHGGQPFEDLENENLEALKNGVCNLQKHLENVEKFGVPSLVCINHFDSDTKDETAYLSKWCEDNGHDYAFCTVFADGARGAETLARGVMNILSNKESHYHPLYDYNLPIKEKISIVCKEMYGAKNVVYTDEAEKQIRDYARLGFDKTPVCIAKTPLSLSDDPKVLGVPKDFVITIREVRLSAGANFIVPLTGAVMTMPGLPKVPAAVKMEDVPYDQKLDH